VFQYRQLRERLYHVDHGLGEIDDGLHSPTQGLENEYAVRLACLKEIQMRALGNLIDVQEDRVLKKGEARSRAEPKVGDLILIRRHQLDKQRGNKLEPRWHGPYVVTKFARSGRSVFYATLQNPTMNVGRRHLDNVVTYRRRTVTKEECGTIMDDIDRGWKEMEGFTRKIDLGVL